METDEQTQTTTALLEAALEYARRGYPVFPIYEPGVDGSCSCYKSECDDAGKHPRTTQGFKDATTDVDQIRGWWTRWPDANIGLATGQGSGLFVLDVDPRNGGDKTIAALEAQHGPLPDTARAISGGGGPHIYLAYPDTPVKSRTLAPGLDIKGAGGYIIAPPSRHANGEAYAWVRSLITNKPADAPGWVLALIAGEKDHVSSVGADSPIKEGERNNTLTSIAGKMRQAGLSHDDILTALRGINETRCRPQLHGAEVERIAESIGKYSAGANTEDLLSHISLISQAEASSWPADLEPEAYHGLAGEVVKAIEPHTEADPAAMLHSFLTGFGNVVGSGPYFVAEADRHALNLNTAIVGLSSKGRKGVSWGRSVAVLSWADPAWARNQIIPGGLSSGEGLIWHVRDPITEPKSVEDGAEALSCDETVIDPGVVDKRVLIVESEFARTLKSMSRDGNTLSPILRQAWDHGNLRVLTKQNAIKATQAHISIIAHVTKGELLKYIDSTEAASGFGNRFLWVVSKRSKTLPEGGQLSADVLRSLGQRVADAVAFAKGTGQIDRDDEARAIWRTVYPSLSADRYGMFGAVVTRAEAQVMRIASIYALLDKSISIRAVHLAAALAVWRRAEASARYIFGDRLGNPEADKILYALRGRGSMTQTDISALFGRHLDAQRIAAAVHCLEKAGLVYRDPKPTAGRSQVVWHLVGWPANKAKEAN